MQGEEPINPAEQAEKQWGHWQQQADEARLSAEFPESFVSELKQVWEGSDYVTQCCQRDLQLLPQLHADGILTRTLNPGEMAEALREKLAAVQEEIELHRTLRRFRRDQMVRIIWRDLSRRASLAETLDDLSELADVAVDQALQLLYRWALEKQGTPRSAEGVQQQLVVLGLGKLGARELNLSSDIDLIFAFPEHGQVDGGRYQTNEQFFIRLCQQLIKALGSQTEDGFVFRVDARLRPFGDSGPMAMSFDAMEEYYQSQAREWERYAMVKARVIGGDHEAGEGLMAMLRPFVYRRYLDFGAIESLRDMKLLISRELKSKGMADNIKLGPGGIREIEFIGQSFQLIRGGRDPDLQIRPILPVLALLQEKELMPEYVVRELTEAYEFLRLVENRLQAWQDRQTHLLPEEESQRLRLARSMDFESWDTFFHALEQHRQRVQGHFDTVFAAPQAAGQEEEEEQLLLGLWRGQIVEEGAQEVLRKVGFDDPAPALKKLEDFRDSRSCRSMEARGQQRMEQLMPLLLEAIGGVENSAVTLQRVLALLEAIARRTAYIALLVESPIGLSQLVRLSSISPWIANRLTQAPLLLDELLDPRSLYTPLRRDDLESQLDTLLGAVDPQDVEQQMERLRQFVQSNMLRVAAADITEVIPLMVVSDYLTEIAEVATARVLDQAWSYLTGRHGSPTGIPGEGSGFAVIAYGKLGGIELGYGSDLDLVFLHGNQDAYAMTDGEKSAANDVFYVRLGQRMIHMYTTRTPSGVLYEVDMRLRPSGNSGMLVASLVSFEQYQREQAWTWEHQALLRARPIAGDPLVAERFRQIRQEVLSKAREPEKLRNDVREMREKMRASLDRSKGDEFDLKQGRGGIADIEFMVQYLVLRWAHSFPDLLDWTDNIRLLEGLARNGILERETEQLLADAYRAFRAVIHRSVLAELPGLVSGDELAAEREAVRELWRSIMESSEGLGIRD
jgi:glutamate-ammonia-ligase adenylyltransferase